MKLATTLLIVSAFAGVPAAGWLLSRGDASAQALDPAASLVDAPLAPHRARLLDLALEIASALPLEPHIKNRSRAQEAVVTTALELGQARRAHAAVERIANWRRGAGYAALARTCARDEEQREAVWTWIEKARAVSAGLTGEDTQDWHKERIALEVALAQQELGGQVEPVPGMTPESMGRLQVARAERAAPDELDPLLEGFDALAATAVLDQVQCALAGGVQLYARFHEDAGKRGHIKDRIQVYWQKAPIMIRIEVLLEMASVALERGDVAEALALVNETAAMLAESRWLPEYRIPLLARLAGLRHQAGDETRARAELEAALEQFDAERGQIVDIHRAGVLRAIAEAFRAQDDVERALRVYALAVEAGIENPNSRPRAEDLSATCLSMALRDIEPDTRLWERMVALSEGLGHPW